MYVIRLKSTKWGSLCFKKVSFKMFPGGYNRGAVSYVEKKRDPEGRCIMTEGKMFVICALYGQKRDYKGT